MLDCDSYISANYEVEHIKGHLSEGWVIPQSTAPINKLVLWQTTSYMSFLILLLVQLEAEWWTSVCLLRGCIISDHEMAKYDAWEPKSNIRKYGTGGRQSRGQRLSCIAFRKGTVTKYACMLCIFVHYDKSPQRQSSLKEQYDQSYFGLPLLWITGVLS